MKKLGEYLLAKDAHAIIVAFICALLPLFYLPVGFIAAVIVGFVTLNKGSKAGFWVIAWVALPAIATLALRRVGAFDVLLLRCFAVWGLAILLQKHRSWGLVLELVATIGVITIVALHFIFPNLHQWWVNQLTDYLNEIGKASSFKSGITPGSLVKRISPFATGLVSFFFVSGVILELALASFWQSIIVPTVSFGKQFIQTRIGKFSAMASILLLILALLEVTVAIDALPLVIFPFFVAGISLIHFLTRLKEAMLGVIIVMYIGIIFLPIFFISALAAIGFIDSWIDIRKRLQLQTKNT